MADAPRAARMAQRIKVIVAGSLTRVIRDEAAENITVTDARVTNDLQNATVYYTVLGDDAVKAEVAELLKQYAGRLRKEVGNNITARLTPTLAFVADEVPVNANLVEDLLRQARAQDAEVAALAEGKTYAGDADPYKRDEDEDNDEDDADDAEGR
ncbi:30S ribosome-binding factor RbfA [Galactobacter caseinivorans]|uniref:Ribosome-binding factor A n=1 Tax=Galactobacter caseinivorans TaxID=2676123 RepID=A0A496PJV6_9MICC|nr:30S ribosome-binding factor RbfA [Galactobacter caseinivorans]RKW70782.1 30S ribosome-binding factor RbfA [Galactobacter caseinivorans]